MPILHLVDRPDDLHGVERRQGAGVLASGVSHAVAASLIFLALQLAPVQRSTDRQITFDTQRLIWWPNPDANGGGQVGGGDNSTQPARPAQLTGDQSITIPTSPQPSTDAIAEPPIEPLVITALPMAAANQALVGTVTNNSTSEALGPNAGPAGDADGPTRGQGKGPRDGIGHGGVRNVGPGVTTPIVIQQVKPQYTADAMRAKVQGSVWLECVVMPDGTVGDVRITRSLDPVLGLDQEAIAAAKQWRFRPGLLKGQPVPVLITIELSFMLR